MISLDHFCWSHWFLFHSYVSLSLSRRFSYFLLLFWLLVGLKPLNNTHFQCSHSFFWVPLCSAYINTPLRRLLMLPLDGFLVFQGFVLVEVEGKCLPSMVVLVLYVEDQVESAYNKRIRITAWVFLASWQAKDTGSWDDVKCLDIESKRSKLTFQVVLGLLIMVYQRNCGNYIDVLFRFFLVVEKGILISLLLWFLALIWLMKHVILLVVALRFLF